MSGPVNGSVSGPTGGLASVLLAGGSGSRSGSAHNKAYASLAGQHVISWSVRTLHALGVVSRWVVVARPQDRELLEQVRARDVDPLGIDLETVTGGATRHESEFRALDHLRAAIGAGEVEHVLLHDASRPLASAALVGELIAVARRDGACIPVVLDDDLRPLRPDGSIDFAGGGTDTARLGRCQTPQVFRADELLRAYDLARQESFTGTDTAACWQRYSPIAVTAVPGDPRNLKITYPQDFFVADALLRARGTGAR